MGCVAKKRCTTTLPPAVTSPALRRGRAASSVQLGTGQFPPFLL